MYDIYQKITTNHHQCYFDDELERMMEMVSHFMLMRVLCVNQLHRFIL